MYVTLHLLLFIIVIFLSTDLSFNEIITSLRTKGDWSDAYMSRVKNVFLWCALIYFIPLIVYFFRKTSKRLIVFVVILTMLYFVLGYAAVLIGWYSKDAYLTFSAIIGSLASVSGLLSFGMTRKLTSEDFENIEIGYLKKVSEAADELKKKNEELIFRAQALTNTEKELQKLEIKKREMEFLIKKASLSLFFQDRLERIEGRIFEMIESNPELHELVHEIRPLKEKLRNFEQEIKSDPNVDLLEEIIHKAESDTHSVIEAKPSIFGISFDIKQLIRTIKKIITS